MKRVDPLIRFKEHMGKKDKNGCIHWNGNNESKYAAFTINNRNILAHRMSYELFVGKIPKNLFVLHKCDNKSCVNPDHLFVGTAKDNAIDMTNKNRGHMKKGEIFIHHLKFKGQDHPRSKLTDSQVVEIKKLLLKGIYKNREISQKFNVCKDTIQKISVGKTWKHIQIPI